MAENTLKHTDKHKHTTSNRSNSGNQPEPTNPASFNAGASRYIQRKNPEKDSRL